MRLTKKIRFNGAVNNTLDKVRTLGQDFSITQKLYCAKSSLAYKNELMPQV